MGSTPSCPIPNFDARIRTSDGQRFRISFHDFIDHITLLRRVAAEPGMMKHGAILDHHVTDYCKRMSQQKMSSKRQQMALPLGIEWVWHVHRLHPLNYHADCTTQLRDRKVVDKKVRQLLIPPKRNRSPTPSSNSINKYSVFTPSIDLKAAIIRQRDFIEKFKRHYLFTHDLTKLGRSTFENMVQNYVSFLKLAQRQELVVPTFDIDLIWHTHMRYPSQYQAVTIALCGFLLDHDDSIESDKLARAYNRTAVRWKDTYQSDYGQNIDRTTIEKTQYVSSCAMVFVPIVFTTSGIVSSGGAISGNCAAHCGSSGCNDGRCGGGDGGCGGGGDGGCGGCGSCGCGGD